jgi:ribonuclease P protein component
VIGRIVATVDFERALGTPPRARSAHFAVHHLAGRPTPVSHPSKALVPELSTGGAPERVSPVDDSVAPPAWWLGTVVPKRHARRSVTRTLLKRQIRSHLLAHSGRLEPGLWVVRLRAPFDRAEFTSAASAALRRVAGTELDAVFDRAAAPAGGSARRREAP